eukprot:scaffold5560_cov444-Prasinococcus_capsulatus_cf.AAC.3
MSTRRVSQLWLLSICLSSHLCNQVACQRSRLTSQPEDLGNGCKLVRFKEECSGKPTVCPPSDARCTLAVPEGFFVEQYAQVPGARQITISGNHGAQDLKTTRAGARAGHNESPPAPWIVYVGTASPFYAWGAKLGRTKGYTGKKRSFQQENSVWALIDLDGDGQVDKQVQVVTPEDGVTRPMGVAWHSNYLYVSAGGLGEPSKILRFGPGVDEYALAGIPFLGSGNRMDLPEMQMVMFVPPEAMPSDQATAVHNWKHIFIHPHESKLYVPVGAPCNECNSTTTLDRSNQPMYNPPQAAIMRDPSLGISSDKRHCTILEFDLNDGQRAREWKIVARGIRNTLGVDWHPDTGDMWFTNNGRDLMGDNTPECTVHRVHADHVRSGRIHDAGFPECHNVMSFPNLDPEDRCQPQERECGNEITWHADSVFGPPQSSKCHERGFTLAAVALGPHNAPLGASFYDWQRVRSRPYAFPKRYDRALFVAEHGSWNRSPPSGYRVSVNFIAEGNKVIGHETFLDGFFMKGTYLFWGRPTDVQQMPDGCILVGDSGGAVWRICYAGDK